MGFDSALMRASVHELEDTLRGARINRIYQHDDRELLLRCYGSQGSEQLLLSAASDQARLQLTSRSFENPPKPPMFCMLLRKRLEQGRIVEVYQDGLERVAVIHIQSFDDLGDLQSYLLTIETMGRHSNIILVNPGGVLEPTERGPARFERRIPRGEIVDAIKRVSPEMSRVRPVQPGLTYEAPPAFDRPRLDRLNRSYLEEVLEEAGNKNAWRAVVETYLGLSPTLAREFALRCNCDPDEPLPSAADSADCLYEHLQELLEAFRSNTFTLQAMFDANGRPVDFAACRLTETAAAQNNELRTYDRPSRMLDDVFATRDRTDRTGGLRSSLLKKVRKRLESLQTRKKHQRRALKKAKSREKYRKYGELVTANLHRLEKGSSEVEVTDWYSSDQTTISIPLDPSLEPNENAQAYFERYNKLKRTEKRARRELGRISREVKYLEDMEYLIESADELEALERLKSELIREGVVPEPKTPEEKDKESSAQRSYHEFCSSDGYAVLAGKSSKGNELITLRIANSDDMWLHVRELAGSHVVVRTTSQPSQEGVPETTLHEAAMIAAYYSKGRESSNVPVDYTRVKHVRKPRGAKPGMVIYDNQQTLWVTPQAETIEKLRVD
jgi:predicted ribosome quality control (RQC) complex YloA/Tae2 family protein